MKTPPFQIRLLECLELYAEPSVRTLKCTNHKPICDITVHCTSGGPMTCSGQAQQKCMQCEDTCM